MLSLQNLKIQRWGVVWFTLAVMILGCGVAVQAQDTTICIKKPVAIKSAIARGSVVDIRVRWQIESDTGRLSPAVYDEFRVWCAEDALFDGAAVQSQRVANDSSLVFYGKDSTVAYYFKVAALRDGEVMATSEIMPFSMLRKGGDDYYRTLGYWFLWSLDHLGILDEDGREKAWVKSSPTGWAAFELIALFFVIGSTFWIMRTWRALRSTKVFLINKRIKGRNECEEVVNEPEMADLNPEQRKIIIEMTKVNLSRLSYRGLLGRIDRVSIWERSVSRRIKPERFRKVPSVRILLSAVAALRSGRQIEDAIEIRVQAEEEELRKRSFIDVLWALGVTAPLVGLFGTVTGISESFKIISDETVKDAVFMKALSAGINEALYTTICGLIVGIMFMLAYYWYNYKLERIHAIWVVFASEFIDRFKHQVGMKAGAGEGNSN